MMGSCVAGGGMMLFGLLMAVGVILLVVLGTWVLVTWRRSLPDGTGSGGHERVPLVGRSRARDILDERYARGELTIEEYWEHLYALQN